MTITSTVCDHSAPSLDRATARAIRLPAGHPPIETGRVGMGGAHVQVMDVVTAGREAKTRHEPDHPLADRAGNVYYPDISEIEEMTDMMSATRSFETGVEVLNRIKSMQQGLLKLGEA